MYNHQQPPPPQQNQQYHQHLKPGTTKAKMSTRKNSTKDFSFESCIGEGSYSKVYNAVSIHNHKTYAIKVLNKSHIVKEKKIKYVNIEKNTLNKLGHHPGIVTLHYTFQDSESLYFVIDFALNGELLSLIRKWGSLSEQVSKYYATQLVDAVEFIHSKGIIHRDLKPENILLNHDYKLMITDFGAAKILTEDTESSVQAVELSKKEFADSRAGSFVGTAEYVSPELLKYNQCGFECDYWAIGCILFQLLTGFPPFKGTTEYLTFEKIIKLDYRFPNYYIPSKFKHLVSNLLVLKPELRYNIVDIKNHEWFKEINWSNKDYIWKRRVPRFESYNPKLYAMKESSSSPRNASKLKFYSTSGNLQSSITSIPDHVLLKKIMTPQSNQQLLNKALTQRLIQKNNELNLQQRNAATLASAAANADKAIGVIPGSAVPISTTARPLPKMESAKPLNRVRSTTAQLPPLKIARPGKLPLRSPQSLPASSESVATLQPPQTVTRRQAQHSPVQGQPPLQRQTTGSPSSSSGLKSLGSKSPGSTINAVGNLVKKSFRSSNNNSNNNNSGQGKASSNSSSVSPISSARSTSISEIIDLGPLLTVSDVPLLPNEYILKADSIYKSELPFPVSATTRRLDDFDDSFLNKLIDENYESLNNDLKPSLLIITSLGRLLIYEFSQVMSTLDPRFAKSSPKRYKEVKLFIVNLTNKNISMYEFDGVFIIKDINFPNIILLNPMDDAQTISKYSQSPAPFADSDQPGIKVNENVSWIDTLLRAKELLKKSSPSLNNNNSSSTESGNSSPEKETIPVSPIEAGMNGLSLTPTTPVVPPQQPLQRNPPSPRQQKPLAPTKVRSTSRTGAVGSVPVQTSASSKTPVTMNGSRSSSSSSISYHYTQHQKSHPPAHQSNFPFLVQTQQNKFASAAAAASFKK